MKKSLPKAQLGSILKTTLKGASKVNKTAKVAKRALAAERVSSYKNAKLSDALSKVNKTELKKQKSLNEPSHRKLIDAANKKDKKALNIATGAAMIVPVAGAIASSISAKKDKAVKSKAKAKVAVEKAKVKNKKAGSYKFEEGGSTGDKKWIQKATASIKRRGTEGKCTPITKPGCTGKARTLALTFKKMAKARKSK